MKKSLSLFLIITLSKIILAQTTSIPDPNFEQALIDLGYDSVPIDGVVLTSNINTITYLDISYTNSSLTPNLAITDITGIEAFTSLTYLDCRGKVLTSLNLTQNTALLSLKCWLGSFPSINLTQNTALTHLELESCDLTSLDLTQNINLEYLHCPYNQLTSLDLTQNTVLNWLDCSDNLLTNLDISQNSNLINFRCYNNQLTSLDVSNNLSLQNLRCYGNQITNGLDLSQHSNLTFLECQNNLLYSLNVRNNNNISFIWFDATNNPNLTCIEVDDSTWATANWSTKIDGNASFSTNCPSICNLSSKFNHIDNGNGNYSFTNTSIGNFSQSHWAFGDGNTSTITSLNHTFNANGTFVVTLTINDSTFGGSCFDYFIDTIVVTGVPAPAQCTAGFVMYPDTTTTNITVVNSSTGTNLTYLWDFGDGNTSILQNPNYTYSTSGPFYLCLTVDDGAGCINQYCDSIGENGVVFKAGGFTINVIGTPIITEIENIEKLSSTIELYPNPVSDQLSIVSDQLNINEINIVDISGKTLKTISDLGVIDVSDLTNGIYFFKIMAEERIIVKKFIKQ